MGSTIRLHGATGKCSLSIYGNNRWHIGQPAHDNPTTSPNYRKGVSMKNNRTLLSILLIALALLLLVGVNDVSARAIEPQAEGIILYVKPGTNGTCTSWADACELQTALGNAVTGDQIWVAAGTYKPTTSTNREATFQLKTGVALYGGFPAAGGDMADRNFATNVTTLSGDIGISGNTSDNSYHVVTGSGVDGTAILDGFTITGGNADGVFPDNYGGGMLNDSGSPTLSNLVYYFNTALFGGGLSNIYSSNPSVNDVKFMENQASEFGGGMYNKYSSSPILTNLTFINNSSYLGGGLANNNNCNPIVTKTTFIENSATGGGGMYSFNNSNATVIDVRVINNSASGGGGMNFEQSDPTLIRVSFVDNIATDKGGGLTFANCWNEPFLLNVTFSNNSANVSGGGLYNHYSSPRLVNVTFTQNSSNFDGGGMFNENSSLPTMTNSILWGNTPDQINKDSETLSPVTYSIVQRGYPGEGNLDVNPLLGNLQKNGGFTETHALQAESPAIDAGNPDPLICPETDQRTLPRPVDGNNDDLTRCDMGAYELQPYNLTMEIMGDGEVDVVPSQPDYALSQQITLTATADPDWTFSSWGGDASGSDNPLTHTILGNTSIIATFTQDEYILTVTPIGSGTVSVDPIQATYHYGDVVTLTPTADLGWTFSGWGGGASGSVNPLIYTIVGNTSITATFSQTEYSLIVLVNPIGAGTVTKSPSKPYYYYGDMVTLTASPVPGWSFTNWSGGASGNTNPLTVTMTGNKTIVANFTQNQYTLTLAVNPVNGGTVAADPLKTKYIYGELVTLTATPAPGWTFTGWEGDATGADNPLTITISGNTSITANFTQDEYTLSLVVDPTDSGTVSVEPLQTTYHYGDEVTLTSIANPGWTFSGWSGDASGTDNPLSVTITGNTTITATFTQNEYTLSIMVDPTDSGTVTVSPDQATYHYGDEVTLTSIANPGWTFTGWAGDASGMENPLMITIEGETNITASFTQNDYTLSVVVDPTDSGTVSVDPLQTTYHYEDIVTLSPTATLGWTFTGWGGDASGTDNPLTITIQGDTNITANFTDQYTLIVDVNPSGSGTVTLDPEQATYQFGSLVTLTPIANPGWLFLGWSGDVTATDNPLVITVEGETNITANFVQFEFIYLPMILKN